MKLWVESASAIGSAGDETAVGEACTATTEAQFVAAVVSGQESGVTGHGSRVTSGLARREAAELASGVSMDCVVGDVLAALPAGEHVAVALLRISHDGRAALAEIDAPPLFMARKGDFVLLPVTEEELDGRLVRRCDFAVQAGDHLALVSEGLIRARGGARPWSWRDIALSVRRLTATGGSAEELAAALARLAGNSKLEARSWKLEAGSRGLEAGTVQDVTSSPAASSQQPATSIQLPASILALRVRPMRSVTVWSGPPADRRRDREALSRLMAEEGTRVICGDTTAEIAARLLGGRLELAPPPPEGWGEVPPALHLTGAAGRLDLLTEGAVTLRVAAGRLAEARRPRDLAGRSDGASRLAQLLLEADKVTLLVGQVVNPAQTERDGTPLRRAAIERLVEALRARGKIVETAFF